MSTEKSIEESVHYIYIYLNPLKPGKFTYNDFISFQHEPFYVGYGKNGRWKDHLRETEKNYANKHKFYTIQKIRNNELEPIITKLNFNLIEEKAKELETFFIKTIGRYDLKLGPLTNMTDGGEGCKNLSIEIKQLLRKKLSEAAIEKYKNPEERKKLSEAAIEKYKNPEERKTQKQRTLDYYQTEKGIQNKKNKIALYYSTLIKLDTNLNRGIPIFVYNKKYDSFNKSAIALNISRNTITNRVKSNKYEMYQFYDENLHKNKIPLTQEEIIQYELKYISSH